MLKSSIGIYSITSFVIVDPTGCIGSATYEAGMSLSHLNRGHIAITPDGMRVFVVGEDNPTMLEQYDLATAFDLNSAGAAFTINLFTVNATFSQVRGIDFNNDGTRAFFCMEGTNPIVTDIASMDLSVAYDFSSVLSNNINETLSNLTLVAEEGRISGDGNKYYFTSQGGNILHTYTTAAPFDITTLTEVPGEQINLFTIIGGDRQLAAFWVSLDGNVLYVYMDNIAPPFQHTVWQLFLSTPYDLSTYTLDPNQLDLETPPLSAGQPSSIVLSQNLEHIFVSGNNGDIITRYDTNGLCSTIPTPVVIPFGCLDGAVYSGDSLLVQDVFSTGGNTGGLHIRANGTDIYVTGGINGATAQMTQYTMPTPNDLSSIPLSGVDPIPTATWDTGLGLNAVSSIDISADGMNLYITEQIGGADIIRWYTLPTAHQLSPAPIVAGTFGLPGSRSIFDGHISNDGSKFYYDDSDGVFIRIVELGLSTDYDITTGTQNAELNVVVDLSNLSGPTPGLFARSIWFNDDESTMYILIGNTNPGTNDYIEMATLCTPGDISTASIVPGVAVAVTPEELNPHGISGNGNNEFLYIIGQNNRIFRYNTTAFSVCSACPTTLIDSGNTFTADTIHRNRGMWMNATGTRLFYLGNLTGVVYQHNIPTPFDLSSISPIATNEGALADVLGGPRGMTGRLDGSFMYAISDATNTIRSYSVSTPGDILTLNGISTDNFAYGGNSMNAILLNPDGSKMYLADTTAEEVKEYDLSPNFDISSAVLSGSVLDTSPENLNMLSMAFGTSGRCLYIAGNNGADDEIYFYRMTTPYDISTASFASVVVDLDIVGIATPTSMWISNQNSLYVGEFVTDQFFQYTSDCTPLLLCGDTGLWVETQSIASLGSSDGQFGTRVAIDGNYFVVGAPDDDDQTPGVDHGRTRIYFYDGATWSLQFSTSTTVPNTTIAEGTAVKIIGDLMVTTDRQLNHVTIYRRSGVNWNIEDTIPQPGGAGSSFFGQYLGFDGTSLAIADPVSDGPGVPVVDSGEVRVFIDTGGGVWGQQTILTSPVPTVSSRFGTSVELDGTCMAIGERGTAEVHMFEFVAGNWVFDTTLVVSTALPVDSLFGQGLSLDISGNTLAIGAPGLLSGAGSSVGTVYIFTLSAGVWTEEQVLTPSISSNGDQFGIDVALHKGDLDQVVVGARGGTGDIGRVFTFNRVGTVWTESEVLLPASSNTDDNFGQALAVNCGNTIIGAPDDAAITIFQD